MRAILDIGPESRDKLRQFLELMGKVHPDRDTVIDFSHARAEIRCEAGCHIERLPIDRVHV